ncbi:hypothetical protein ACFL2K_02840 [Candidatus Margulisiibacteriota bacterium]
MVDLKDDSFCDKGIIYQIGVAPCRIDIITKISGYFAFKEAKERTDLLSLGKVKVPVLSINDLIINKRTAARGRDLEDAKHLEKHLRKKKKA